ncbi:MAG: SARP family transcriptional regulator [Actinophytocola sp.]|uniref:AfsR/SARP family transcriptional regulator n=1 Tax=Actinophytocola sp. TaxID=1872138 RepID=UPI00132AF04C|nr:BTAD domain-containing putative transcriptional regulator [Actinophytocola sp.]MPZ81854.1 SARP family transcriptional regulator [Actinophytocola sp.]
MRLLDGFELRVDDDPVPVLPSSQRLLAYLAMHQGPVTRAVLAAALWPRATERRAAACLRSTVWRLVKPPHALVDVRQGMLEISAAPEVDVIAVRRFAAELAVPTTGWPTMAVPFTALTAELLPGWTDHWIDAERNWFRQLCLRALEMLSERFRIGGDHFHAHETAVAAVRSDPLRESTHRRLIELHLADANPAAALRQYVDYRSRLRTELGLTPSHEIRRLVEPILTDRVETAPPTMPGSRHVRARHAPEKTMQKPTTIWHGPTEVTR